MDAERQASKGRKIAAALAAVEALLRDEAAAAGRTAVPAIPRTSSAWALSGRLASMNARMAGGPRGRG